MYARVTTVRNRLLWQSRPVRMEGTDQHGRQTGFTVDVGGPTWLLRLIWAWNGLREKMRQFPEAVRRGPMSVKWQGRKK